MYSKGKQKRFLRQALIELRNRMNSLDVEQKSEEIAKQLISSGMLEDVRKVFSYIPIKNEVKTDIIHNYLWDKGAEIFVPYTDEDFNIIPCLYQRDGKLTKERFSVLVPEEKIFLKEVPDLIIIPAVGMDPYGNRIGYGKGCYDRYLKKNNGKTVALVYDFQVIKKVPAQRRDISILKVLTEEGFVK